MSALLEIVNRSKATEQATADRRLCRKRSTRWVRISTGVEGSPSRSRKERTLERVDRIAVAVAYEHYRNVYPMTLPTDGVTAVILPPLRPDMTMPADTDLPDIA